MNTVMQPGGHLRSLSRTLVAAAFLGGILAGLSEPAHAASPKKTTKATRTEHDLLGEKQIPADAYYGVQALRGMENFQISGVAINH